ncbi:MAG: DUF2235 domain-containing protein, partial [Bradyrhizobium sp.]
SSGPGSVPVKLLSIFDTVGALGIPLNAFWKENRDLRGFHDVALSEICEHSVHAVAIDEHREAFEATLWRRLPFAAEPANVEQVWFAGAHADVGGGYERRDASHLDDITLDWMMRRIIAIGGADFPLDPPAGLLQGTCARAPQHEPRQGLYRFMPYVFRSIGNQPVPVASRPFERNVCLDRHSKPIGEAIHVSAIERLGQQIKIDGVDAPYVPRNLVAALHFQAALKEEDIAIPVIGWSGSSLPRHQAMQLIKDGLARARIGRT